MNVDFPDAVQELFRPHRYKVLYGGRGSAKSWSVARALLVQGCGKKLRILCVREIQHSISESVHRLLSDQIWAMGLNGFYEITKNAIVGANGTEFLFKGIKFNTEEIKSTEGVDICWVEEAEKVSAESWDILIPTIRKDNSEIIIVFNPDSEDSPTYQRFVVHPPKGAWVRKINYTDNPYFPDVLRQDMEWCKERDYEAYLNIWEGECKKHSNALIFAGRFKVEDFDTPLDARFYHGCDWGFSCLSGDTLITTDKGEKPIKDIAPGDMVLTRNGYKPVLHLLRRGVKEVYSLDYGGGKPLTVTGDHKIFTIDGWKRADELKEVETVCVAKKSNLTGEFTNDTRTENTPTISIANGKGKENTIAPYTIETYGNTTTGKSQKDTLSIMLMGTRLTTVLKTLSALHLINTHISITKTIWGLSQKIKSWSIGKNTATQKRIGQSVERSQWQPHNNGMEYVKNAGNLSQSQMYTKNSAPHDAGKEVIAEMLKENTSARYAGQHLSLQVMTEERPVLTNAHIHLAPLNDKQEVFDLTVEGEHEFFANGLLVHNCDPTTLIRCFMQDRTIFIDREAWGVGVDLDETPALFDTIDTARKWPIKADCARPETISYMRRQGFKVSAAKKWAGSIEDGIEFLKAYDIVIHPRCRHTIDEFNNYSYKVDKQTGDVLPVIVDAWNHCLKGDTLILTAKGEKPIKDIQAGEYVYTRQGLRKVLWSGETRQNARVFSVCANGYKVTGTADHKIFTANRGWVEIGNIRKGDLLLCSVKQSKHTGKHGADTPILADVQTANISNVGAYGCIGTHGNMNGGRFRKGWLYTIKTGIAKTTRLITLSVFPKANTGENILSRVKHWKDNFNNLEKFVRLPLLGIKAEPVTNGTRNMQRCFTWANTTESRADANNAERHLSQKHTTMNFVPMPAKAHGEGRQAWTISREFAPNAGTLSRPASIHAKSVVLVPVQCVEDGGIEKAVYDLTVEGEHEFFANGILVHNCIDALRYSLDGVIKGRGAMKINPAALVMR